MKAKRRSHEPEFKAQREQVNAKIGAQAVELDFLRKKSKQFGL